MPKIKLKLKKNKTNGGLIWAAVIVALLLFGVSGWLWWTRVLTDADKVFAGMLDNNLSSASVTRRVVQQDQSSSVDQTIYMSFWPPETTSQTRTVLSEKAQNGQATTVTTETIGTKGADYVRYLSAEGANELSLGGNLEQVLGVWAKRSSDADLGEATTFLNEAAFSIVPYGNLPDSARQEMLKLIDDQNVYQYTQAKRGFVDGRYAYTYTVSIRPSALIEVLAKYAELTGIGDSSQLSPASYAEAAPVNLQMTVDIPSRQLMSIEYLASGRVETIESRGTYHEIALPADSIPFEDLQKRLIGRESS